MKKKKKISSLLLVLFLLIILVLGASFFLVSKGISLTSTFTDNETTEFTVEPNSFGKDVFNKLENRNIINNGLISYYYSRIKGYNMDFKAGDYLLNSSMDLEDILDYISNGQNAIQDTVSVKLGEGSRAKDFASKISEATNLDYDGLIDYWNNPQEISLLMNDYSVLTKEIFKENIKCLLEGYLFPDTYEFFTNTSYEEVTRKLLDNTQSIYDKYIQLFNDSFYTIHEVFTLSSIVQRESGNISDMADIASVFYNRLSIGMQLQSSVTVCYALDIGLNGDWTKCEITQNTYDPYNTYQIIGLPPGPICNPSEDAILATLKPNQTDYFFFIGDVCGDGTTYFARTYEEQLINQETYLTCY